MSAVVAADTSVAVAYVLRSHSHHDLVRRKLKGFEVHLTSHSLAETYSVLTRLPADARLTANDASAIIDANFPVVVPLPTLTATRLHKVLAELGIAGGAVYDALVALAAKESRLPLVTRDARAASTYVALSVEVRTIVD